MNTAVTFIPVPFLHQKRKRRMRWKAAMMAAESFPTTMNMRPDVRLETIPEEGVKKKKKWNEGEDDVVL